MSFTPDLAVRLICPECKDPIPNIIEDFASGDLICGAGGLVLGDKIVDTRSEWRTFADSRGQDPSRVGAETNLFLEGACIEQLGTVICFAGNGSSEACELKRALRTAHGAASQSERKRMAAFRDISTICESMSLPPFISERAKQLYTNAEKESPARAYRTHDAVVASCVLASCREADVPRTFDEIQQITRVPKKSLYQCLQAFKRTFDPPRSGPESLINRYCNQLNLDASIVTACGDVVIAARNYSLTDGRSPLSIAGAVIHFTSHLFGRAKSAKEVGVIVGVSEHTVKSLCRTLCQERDKLVKREWLDSGRAVMERLPGGHTY